MFRTKFEKYKDEVLKWLKRHKVDTERYLAPITSIITDYYDEIEPAWAAQCIKAELSYEYGKEKIIKESVGEEVDNFIDTVLDELSDIASDAYDYYKDHREEIIPFMEKGVDAIDVANKLDDMYNAEEFYNEKDPEDYEHKWSDSDLADYWLDDNGYVDTSNNPGKEPLAAVPENNVEK